jgi:tetratricopeptide (TPR) repeat protein/DNA polymerase III delta prime subunit
MGLVHATEQSIKQRIIAIMSVVKARLRRQRITLGAGTDDTRFESNVATQSLVDMIRLRGCEMPGNRFSDIFLSRPTRIVNASVLELVTTFEVILDLGHQFLPANELIALCELTRVPFGEVQSFARYYPVDEWRSALQQYNLTLQSQGDDDIMERDDLITDLANTMIRAFTDRAPTGVRHVIISGPSGIGKTAVAIAIARRIEPIYAKRIPIVVLSTEIGTLEHLYRAIGVTIGMKLIGNEPWSLRMRNTTALRNAIVILDNLVGAPGLSPEAMLQDVTHALPTTMFIVTTQMVGLAQVIARAAEVSLGPLEGDQGRRLFWRIYRNAHGQDIDPDDVTRLLEDSYGFPMHIIASANAAAHGGGRDSNARYQQVVSGIAAEALIIVQILSLIHQPVTIACLGMFLEGSGLQSTEDLRQIMQQLERRQIVTLRRNEGYVMHDALRLAVRSVMPSEQVVAVLAGVAAAIHTPTILREDNTTHYSNNIQTHEVLAVLELVDAMQRHGLTEAVARIAVHWRMIWIRFGVCAEWCTITDDVARVIGEGHPLYAPLMHALGSFYGHRGMVERSVLSLQTALRVAEQRGQADIWAMAALECALHGMQSIGIAESERLLLRALAQFERLTEQYWVARCYDTLSYVYVIAGQLQQALKASDEALTLYGSTQVSHGRGDAHANRGLIYTTMGDYELARQELIKAEQIFQKLNAPSNTAAVHLRIAAISALWNRPADARFYLVKAFRVLERSGGLNDLLFVIDICAGLALAEGDGRMAVQLSAACTHLRHQQSMPRGEALDAIVVRQLEYAHMLLNDKQVAPLSANLVDLVLTVRTYLYGNEPLLWE